MSEATHQDERDLRVRDMIATIDLKLLDQSRRRQEITWAPWQIVITAMGTGAALFAAGTAFMKVLGG